MKIALSGSATSIERMYEIKTQLEQRGHEVYAPKSEILDEDGKPVTSQEYVRRYRSGPELSAWALRSERKLMHDYFPFLEKADALLVVNVEKKGIVGYIGGSTFLEMSISCYLGKKIYLLHPAPRGLIHSEDILLIDPTIIDGDLDRIR